MEQEQKKSTQPATNIGNFMEQEQKKANQLAINIGNFMTSKMTVSLFSLLSFIIIIILFVSYRMSSGTSQHIQYRNSIFSNKSYDF